MDAERILIERGHTTQQVARLARELGKDLKLVAEAEERAPQTREMQFGRDKRQVGLHHGVHDAPMIETVLASFKAREIYSRVLSEQPDTIRAKREELLHAKGRGRSRSERRAQHVGGQHAANMGGRRSHSDGCISISARPLASIMTDRT